MTDAEIEAQAIYTDGAIDEVYTMADRAMTTGRIALGLAFAAMVLAVTAIALALH
ncbi:hypothetical protein [Bradyrhizobium betae]|uniref:hypothetical protein n=1 Tax=Bradyrhizobium betae TaxID=244734 RepID=UPI0012B68677|nr:hypothetical protein [Bradyrhizobium betae]MCS3725462.1 hypothetical protein [Bradyrhizobium betae]